jgi:hypothetical protein
VKKWLRNGVLILGLIAGAPAVAQQQEISTKTTGSAVLPQGAKDTGIYVEFRGHPEMTSTLRKYFQEQGYKLTGDKKEAVAQVYFTEYYSIRNREGAAAWVSLSDLQAPNTESVGKEKHEVPVTQGNYGAFRFGQTMGGGVAYGILANISANLLVNALGLPDLTWRPGDSIEPDTAKAVVSVLHDGRRSMLIVEANQPDGKPDPSILLNAALDKAVSEVK